VENGLPKIGVSMKLLRFSLFLFILLFIVRNEGFAQERAYPVKDSLVWKRSILPVAFYLPETSFAFGATGILTFKKSSAKKERPSQILFAGIYTLKNQIEFLSVFEIYADQRKHRLKGEVGFYRYFYNYFGIGPESRSEDLEKYDVTFPRFEVSYARKLYKIFNVGLGYKMDYFNITGRQEEGLLDTNRPVGWDGGFKSNAQAVFFVDTRDNLNAPYKGFYGELVFQRSLDFFFSDFDYTKVEADIRYFTPFGNTWTLGHQLWITHSTSGTPFYDLAHISTASRSRGFDDRRFINAKMVTLQSELRFPIKGRFRGNAFYTFNVMPNSWSRIFGNREFLSYGAGLRYILKKESRTVIRLDLARGDGRFNFYVTLNEAF